MARFDVLRWSRLRPASPREWIAALAAAMSLAFAIATSANVALVTGIPILTVASLLALVFTTSVLVLAALAAGLAWLARRARWILCALLLAGLSATLVGLAVVPQALQWQRARTYGVRISLGDLVHPTLGSGRLVGRRSIPTADGEHIDVEIWTSGRVASPRPAVVLVHGGGWISGRPGSLPAWNRWLPDQGFTVIDVSYRLPDSVGVPWRPEIEVGDVKCALGWTSAHAAELGIDPSRISVMGHSAGGNLAALAAYTRGDPALPPTCPTAEPAVRSVVSFYGPPDLRGMWDHAASSGYVHDALREYLGGSPDEQGARYALLSPAQHVSAAVPPTFSTNGESDALSPVRLVRALGTALEQAGATHEEWYLPATDHGFDAGWGALNTQIVRAKLEAFLHRYG